MGEVIAFGVVIASLVIGMLLYAAFKPRKVDNVSVVTIRIPPDEAERVLDELTELIKKRRPGVVEFYASKERIVRFVKD